MIDLDQLLDSIDESLDDWSKYQAAQQLLCLTVRKHNKTCEELERLKEAAGFNKPFPFLRLPREIRDKIYAYSLRAPIAIHVAGFSILTTKESPFKPPTPGLLRANKQIYQEAIEILYSRNIFTFEDPYQLFTFEEQVRLEHRELVTEVSIWIFFVWRNEGVLDPKHLPRSEYRNFTSHWIEALRGCSFQKIVHLRIEAEMVNATHAGSLSMPKDLQEFIMEFLGKVPGDKVPRLSLIGFREEERDKFPTTWEVVVEQSEAYKRELRELQEEIEENPIPPEWAVGYGDSEDDGEFDDDE